MLSWYSAAGGVSSKSSSVDTCVVVVNPCITCLALVLTTESHPRLVAIVRLWLPGESV